MSNWSWSTQFYFQKKTPNLIYIQTQNKLDQYSKSKLTEAFQSLHALFSLK